MPVLLSSRQSGQPSMPRESSLAGLRTGDSGVVAELEGPLALTRRLSEMGFTPGTPVTIRRVAPLGDPMEIELRGYRLSLRRDQAGLIRLGGAAIPPASTPAEPTGLSTPGLPTGRDVVIALAGNPNSGKTTLFNAITGLRQKVANYPGVTVDKKIGRAPLAQGRWARIIDLPGTYSLTPGSPDERIAVEVLAGLQSDTPLPDVVVAVVDTTNLARNLLLTTQVIDAGLPVVVALTMMDEARKRGSAPDADHLARLLGVPVIPVVAATGEGLTALRNALEQAKAAAQAGVPWRHAAAETAIDGIVEAMEKHLPERRLQPPQLRLLASHLLVDSEVAHGFGLAAVEPLTVAAARARGDGRVALEAIQLRYAWIDAVVAAVQNADARSAPPSRLDAVLLHRIGGPVAFAMVMWGLFMAIFTLAAPVMDLAESGVIACGAWVAGFMGPGLLHDLWLQGVVAGVGGVVIFAPQIAVMFIIFAVLEESGYLARGAFILDRLLSVVGLHGRSFVPLLSSHACAIPGIMSARAIPDRNERLATMLVAPFMSCGARLPVYGLLIGAFFGGLPAWQQGSIMFALYTLGIVSAAVVAWTLRRTALRGVGASFLIELPPYRWPSLGEIVRVTVRAVWAFVRRAGTIILAFSILLWAAMTFPRLSEARVAEIAASHGTTVEAMAAAAEGDTLAATATAAAEQAALAQTIAGRAGHLIEPIIAPLGMDWQVGIGLIGAFAAREVFVSTMGITYGVGSVDDQTAPLEERMKSATRPDGTPVWTPLLAVVVLVWFVLAMQCLSTMAVMVRETGGWRWPLLQLAGMNALAWILGFAIWQIGSRFV
jgi:ferrous iron transport protein B